MAFWASIPLSVVGVVGYLACTGESLDLSVAFLLLAIIAIILLAYASSYVEITGTPDHLTIRKPYSVLPFTRCNELRLADISRVALWTVNGKSFNFFQDRPDAWLSKGKLVWTVQFLALPQSALQRFASYLQAHGIHTSGF